jgi:DNA-directed RNA polymerase subunit L
MSVTFSQFEKDARIPNKCSFIIDNMHVGILNALRRVILSEIPNIAVSFDAYHKEHNDCVFHINTSSLHNEFLGHRISLIPIHLPPEIIDSFTPEQFKFEINVRNESTDNLLVTSEHIKVYDSNDVLLSPEKTKQFFPPDPITNDYIIITKLKPNLYEPKNGEHLHVVFRARKGIAKMNAAWCPVSLCSYSFVIDPILAAQTLEEKLANITDENEKAAVVKSFERLDNQRCFYRNHHGEACKFQFTLESECAMSCEYLFNKALDILVDKLKTLEEGDKYEIYTINEEQHFYAIKVHNEDHTLGNLLQVLIHELFIINHKGVTFAGYNVPHPLEESFILKIRFDKLTNVDTFLKEVVREGSIVLKDIQQKWHDFHTGEKVVKKPKRIVRKK